MDKTNQYMEKKTTKHKSKHKSHRQSLTVGTHKSAKSEAEDLVQKHPVSVCLFSLYEFVSASLLWN